MTALIGDMFASKAQAIVNTVNCVGIMGKGVALEFKRRYPAMFQDYEQRCARKEVRVGEPYVFQLNADRLIVNFPTKDHWRSPSRLSDIEAGLDLFVERYVAWGVTSIAFPPLGCGNGGLLWSDVGQVMYQKLNKLPIPIEVYAPFGTVRTELEPDFLGASRQLTIDDRGRSFSKMPEDWAVIVETLRRLGEQPFANPIGRTIFQKLCYVLSEMGLDTGFNFSKGSYGPFAEEVKKALHIFANRNWIQEKTLGRMLALRVEDQFDRDRPRYVESIARHERKIAKAVDLFSRIKSTEQAEEMVTILFAVREIKREKPDQELTEQDLFKFIQNWKKAWRTDERRLSVATAIRSLVILGWMKLLVSEDLVEA